MYQAAPAPPTGLVSNLASETERLLQPSAPLVEEVRQPVINIHLASYDNVKNSQGAYRVSTYWTVPPHEVPALSEGSPVVRDKFGRTIADVTPVEGGYRLRNLGKSHRLFRLGSKDYVYYVYPGSTNTIPNYAVRPEMARAATIHTVPANTHFEMTQ